MKLVPEILLLSNKEDISLDYVSAELNRHPYPFFRLNCEDLTTINCSFHLLEKEFVLVKGESEIVLGSALRSVIFRRPGQPYISPVSGFDEKQIENYVSDQWSVFINGLRCFDDVKWINSPEADRFCENKILQLVYAQELGFAIPDTLISSDRNCIENFFAKQHSEVVVKALCSPLLELETGDFFIFSNAVDTLEPFSDEEFRTTPSIFQQLIKDKIDVRVTVCGKTVFAVEIRASIGKTLPMDWRTSDQDLQYVPIELPLALQKKCVSLTKKFGLTFGAIDFVRVGETFLFLEINPAGEWGWLQRRANLPIAEAIAAEALASLRDSQCKS